MKKITRFFAVAVVAVAAMVAAAPAQAQFKFGIKAGAAINNLKFSSTEELVNSFAKENRAGFVGGVMIDFTVPVIGVGLSLIHI